jgi:hypothetical protein
MIRLAHLYIGNNAIFGGNIAILGDARSGSKTAIFDY